MSKPNVGHFGHGHFGHGRFCPDISAMDVSDTENAKGGRFGQNRKLWVRVCACINVAEFLWPKRPWPKCPGRNVLGRNVRGRNVRQNQSTQTICLCIVVHFIPFNLICKITTFRIEFCFDSYMYQWTTSMLG